MVIEIYERLTENGTYRYLVLFARSNENNQNFSSIHGFANKLSVDEVLKKYEGEHGLPVYTDTHNHLHRIVKTFKLERIYKEGD